MFENKNTYKCVIRICVGPMHGRIQDFVKGVKLMSTNKKGGPEGGPTFGQKLKILQRGPKRGGVRTPWIPPPCVWYHVCINLLYVSGKGLLFHYVGHCCSVAKFCYCRLSFQKYADDSPYSYPPFKTKSGTYTGKNILSWQAFNAS